VRSVEADRNPDHVFADIQRHIEGRPVAIRCVITGAPSSGKGRYADSICKHYNVPHVTTGDLLRKAIMAKSELGKAAQAYMDKGEIVADDVIVPIVIEHLNSPDVVESGW
jgi:adenylate kinase